MLTGKEDLLEALIDAYLMEKGTREFYSHAAQKAAAKDARETFAALSAWEERHMDYIQYLYQAIQEDRDIQGFEEFGNRSSAPLAEGGIPVKDLEAGLKQPDFMNDLDALDMALDIEGKAYALYQKLSRSAPDANARVVFGEMMEQELRHVDYLKKTRPKVAV